MLAPSRCTNGTEPSRERVSKWCALKAWLLDEDLLAPREIQRVGEAINRIKESKHTPTEDRLLAALSFGFWTSLLGTRYEELWRRTLHSAFPNGDGTRHEIAGFTNRIVQFRNRLAHHEPLFNRPVVERHADMLELAGAISTPARTWIERRSAVLGVLAARPKHPAGA